jgi:alpha-L-rhamnosidase
LTKAEAALITPYGKAAARWALTDGSFTLNITVPPNTTAEVALPNGERYTAGSGEYEYAC